MIAKLKAAWAKVLAWCHDSESIVLARAQVLAGVLIGAVVATASVFDLGSVLAGTVSLKQAAYLFAAGVVQEVIRKYRAEDLK